MIVSKLVTHGVIGTMARQYWPGWRHRRPEASLKRVTLVRQSVLSCGCGEPAATGAGLCRLCARRVRLSRERFGGLREPVLRRDGYRCRGCGELNRGALIVHHRWPGRTLLWLLVTLCRGCHVKVHRRKAPALAFSPFLLMLWRELHRGWPEKGRLAFLLPAEDAVAQGSLFEA